MLRREWLVLAGAGLLGGCAVTRDNVDPAATDLSVIAGHIDMRGAPSNLRWVSIKAYGPGADNHYIARVEDGFFFHVGIEAGSYQIDKFGGVSGIAGFGGRFHEYEWGTRGRNETAVRINRPDVYFVGSWRYVAERSGMFEAARFDMQPARSPGEQEVLRRVLQVMEGDSSLRVYAHQKQRLRARVGAIE